MQNPLESYRRTQRELRRQFETFTQANCPTCPTPCCRQPARIVPTDILLAESTGWKGRLIPLEPVEAVSHADSREDMVTAVAGRVADAFHTAPETAEAEPEALPCEYLGEKGCTFPTDLRPFGCTTYICKYMFARMDRPTLTRVKRLVRELEDKHTFLMRTLHKG